MEEVNVEGDMDIKEEQLDEAQICGAASSISLFDSELWTLVSLSWTARLAARAEVIPLHPQVMRPM